MMDKHELVDKLQRLAEDSKEIVVALKEHCPESGKAEELMGASYILLEWADSICAEQIEADSNL